MNTKKRQSKTNGTKTRVVHVAIPLPTFNRIRKMAEADDRSINYKIVGLIESAVDGVVARESRRQYEAQK